MPQSLITSYITILEYPGSAICHINNSTSGIIAAFHCTENAIWCLWGIKPKCHHLQRIMPCRIIQYHLLTHANANPDYIIESDADQINCECNYRIVLNNISLTMPVYPVCLLVYSSFYIRYAHHGIISCFHKIAVQQQFPIELKTFQIGHHSNGKECSQRTGHCMYL